jgi:glyceraldehyde-3-phosphate dehydrogenase/erythrose-4-phosphate dehydrogenase
MIRVAVNGYGTIGKRVADAVAAQDDMEVVGVSKTHPSPEAFVAAERGYPLYIADMAARPAFEKADLPVAGSVEEMIAKADVVVDATPAGVGALLALLFFNIGVEVGQLMFIAAVYAAMRLLFALVPDRIDLRRAAAVPAVMIGGLASFWVIERVYNFWV